MLKGNRWSKNEIPTINPAAGRRIKSKTSIAMSLVPVDPVQRLTDIKMNVHQAEGVDQGTRTTVTIKETTIVAIRTGGVMSDGTTADGMIAEPILAKMTRTASITAGIETMTVLTKMHRGRAAATVARPVDTSAINPKAVTMAAEGTPVSPSQMTPIALSIDRHIKSPRKSIRANRVGIDRGPTVIRRLKINGTTRRRQRKARRRDHVQGTGANRTNSRNITNRNFVWPT